MTKISNVTIISDGTPDGTKVQVGDGLMEGVLSIEVQPIKPDRAVQATIKILMPKLRLKLADADIVCCDPLTEHQIKEALIEYRDKE